MISTRTACIWVGLAFFIFSTRIQAQTNGLEGREREEWYHLSQGTEFFPLRAFLALNDADTGKRFKDNLERFGLIADPSESSPFGLPIGMTVAEIRDLRFGKVKMIGLNCSACHTAAFDVGGPRPVRIDGATNMFDPDRFRVALARSAQHTLTDKAELVRFIGRVIRQAVEDSDFADDELVQVLGKVPFAGAILPKVAERLESILDAVDGPEKILSDKLHATIRDELDKKPIDLSRGIVTSESDPQRKAMTRRLQESAQPGSMEGFSALNPAKRLEAAALHEIVVRIRLLRARLEMLKNSGHPIMTEPGFGRVDAFGTARNKLFPDKQKPLDAPVRFPFLWTVKNQLEFYHWDANTNSRQERNTGEALGVGVVLDPETFESTIRFKELQRLESLAMKITAPSWPKEFGPIDSEKASRGKKHFDQWCSHCHAGAKANGTQVVKLDHIKTDPRRVLNIRQPVGTIPFFEAISPILKKTIEKAGGTPEGLKSKWRPSPDLDPNLIEGYPNRPIPSVWASPPYLHNGSVPNLYQLLLPATQRVKEFPLGHRDYDTKHLGYSLSPSRVVFKFDTRQTGNSNSGHSGQAYGTEPDQMTDEKRWELVEYLKTHR
jgi:hypothetical protein